MKIVCFPKAPLPVFWWEGLDIKRARRPAFINYLLAKMDFRVKGLQQIVRLRSGSAISRGRMSQYSC